MDVELFKQQALRARDLAEQADPFIRKRLLALAERYDAKVGVPSPASRMIERLVPLREWPASTGAQSGEA